MYLRAGLFSLGLLLLSRVLGLLRESVQAASFGTTALADVVVTMLTLPDLASSALAGGALSYVLLPWWARQSPNDLAASQRRAAQYLFGAGLVFAAWMLLMPALWAQWLAPGTAPGLQTAMQAALRWSALAVPISLVGFVWYTRLQHERDVVGMYGMNLVHTSVVIVFLFAVGHDWEPLGTVAWLGLGLLLAFGLRSAFLRARLRRVSSLAAAQPVAAVLDPVRGLPAASLWLWALLATGLPVLLPLLARSMVSHSAAGALASFNYAWKLIELPNILAIQLVSVLAFPALTRAHAEGRAYTVQLRTAFVMSWTLACAGALGLSVAAGPVADLLFGWGRMHASQVAAVATWAALGAWTLLPQSIIAVCLLVLATTGRLRTAALVYALVLALVAASGVHEGLGMMQVLCAALGLAAAALLLLAGRPAWQALAGRGMGLPMALPLALALGLAWAVRWAVEHGAVQLHGLLLLGVGVLATGLLLLLSYACSPVLRAALQR